MKDAWKSLAVACAVVIGVYAYTAPLGALEASSLKAADTYYNLLVQGFRAGQLSLKKEVPPGFAQLADPYDPSANLPYRILPYRMSDLSYYKGRLYLYFGVTPVLILFWPFVALTGHYLFDRAAVTIFCAVGFLASIGLLRAMWRRYFPEVSVWVVAACALALALATGVPALLPQSDIYQVAISCGYMLTMLALGAVWCALHESEPRKRSGWLAMASLAYGLAVAARPDFLFGGVILLVPVMQAWRERLAVETRHEWRSILALLVAAMGPIILIGLGLMLYNFLRFDNPLEFGQRYQLDAYRPVVQQYFSLHNLWFNSLVYFLEPVRWSTPFPFVHQITVPPLPLGYFGVQDPFGVLTNIPLAWLALAVPLAWRERSDKERGVLRWFVTTVCLLFGMCALTLGFYCSAAFRYEVDFLPALMLLAVVGVLGLERVLADRPFWRRAARCGWGLLLGFSIAFNVLVSVENYAHAGCALATVLAQEGRVPEAIQIWEKALRVTPDDADGHANFANALQEVGKVHEAIGHYEQALRIAPDDALAHNNLGNALFLLGKVREAAAHYEQALRLKPDHALAQNNLGGALLRLGRSQEAVGHYEQALRLKPDFADAHYNLGNALLQVDKLDEAIRHFEQGLRLKPDNVEAHYNLGNALLRSGKTQEAIGHYEQVLRLKPDYAEAHNNLGDALMQAGKLDEAIGHYEQALRLKPGFAETHGNLAIALEQTGKPREAIAHWEQALHLKPDDLEARYNKLGNALARAGKVDEAIGYYEQALRIAPDDALAHYTMGNALFLLGKVREAAAHYEQALRLKPDFAEAKAALARLQAVQ